MSEKLVNIRIRQIGDTASTIGIFLDEEPGKISRKLKPGEVVAVPESYARNNARHVEVVFDSPTRPVCFDSKFEAKMTDPDYRPKTVAGKKEQAEAREQVRAKLAMAEAKRAAAPEDPSTVTEGSKEAANVKRR